MIKKLNKLLLIVVVVAIVSYTYILNPSSVTIYLSRSSSVTAPSAFLILASFICGILFSSVFLLFFGFKAYLRERHYQSLERQRVAVDRSIAEARSHHISGEWGKAREIWERIVSRFPGNSVSRIELAKSYHAGGQTMEALKVLDKARSLDPDNIEILFTAADLNIALGNKTAAIDNLALILYHHPSKKAARMARDLSEEIGRIDDAIEYQTQLDKLGDEDESRNQILLGLRYQKLLKDFEADQETLKSKLRDFTRGKETYVPALEKLAEMEISGGNTEEGAKLLLRASKISGDSRYWQEAARLWLKLGVPDRAIAAARAGTKELKGYARVNSELELIKLYLALNMIEEARVALDGFDSLMKSEEVSTSDELKEGFLLLKGRCLNALGMSKEAEHVWQQLTQESIEAEISSGAKASRSNGAAPSPSLSTP